MITCASGLVSHNSLRVSQYAVRSVETLKHINLPSHLHKYNALLNHSLTEITDFYCDGIFLMGINQTVKPIFKMCALYVFSLIVRKAFFV